MVPADSGDSIRTVRSVGRAAAVLDCFLDGPQELGVSEISRELKLSKGTVHSLLASLEKSGLIATNPQTHKYGLGLKILALANALQQHLDIRRVALPYLHDLVQLTDETASLHIRVGDGQVCIDQVVCNNQVRRIVDLGVRKPLHTGSSGKAFLAFSTVDDQEHYLTTEPLTALTPKTIVEPAQLRAEWEEARRRGYTTSYEEHDFGVTGMAFPVFDHRGNVVAAIGISGPSSRFTPDKIQALASEVLALGDRLSRSLGYRGVSLHDAAVGEAV